MLKSFTLASCLLTAVALVPGSAHADICGLNETLSRQDARLGTTISVTPKLAAQMEQAGIAVERGLFGGKFVRTDAIRDYLARSNCDAEMMAAVSRRATVLVGTEDPTPDPDTSTAASPEPDSEPDSTDGDGPGFTLF